MNEICGVDMQLIEDYRRIVKLFVGDKLREYNVDGRGEEDKAEFEQDFDKILDLAIIGLAVVGR